MLNIKANKCQDLNQLFEGDEVKKRKDTLLVVAKDKDNYDKVSNYILGMLETCTEKRFKSGRDLTIHTPEYIVYVVMETAIDYSRGRIIDNYIYFGDDPEIKGWLEFFIHRARSLKRSREYWDARERQQDDI